VNDHIFGGFRAKNTVCIGLVRTYKYTVYDRVFGDFPTKNTEYTTCIMVLANPTYIHRICTVLASPLLLSPQFSEVYICSNCV